MRKYIILWYVVAMIGATITSCSNEEEPQPEPIPKDENIVYEVKLNFDGDIPIFTESEEPISRADENTPKRVYGLNVWCMKNDETVTLYKYYGYGLFDNKDDMVISLLSGYKYRFECYMVEDDEEDLYISSSKNTGEYPFAGRKIMNEFIIGSSYSGFHFDDTKITTAKSYSTVNTAGYSYPEKSYQDKPEIGIYYGMLSDYIPSKNSIATIPIYKIGYFGWRIIITGVPEEYIDISPDPEYRKNVIKYEYDRTNYTNVGILSYRFTKADSIESKFTSGFYSALSDPEWLDKMQNFTTTTRFTLYWKRSNGYTQVFSKDITLKRNVITVLTVNLSGGANDISMGFEEYSNDMSIEYDSFDILQSDDSIIPEDMAIAFPDEKFRNYILRNFDINNDEIISNIEALQVNKIDVNGQGISSIEGIQYFPNLERLYCVNNKLTSIDVSNNRALTHLQCYHNQLTSIDVSNNPKLTQLWIYTYQDNFKLSELDISNNTALTDLRCPYNNLTSLNISNNKALKYLNCGYNNLNIIDISNNTSLTNLICHSNQLTVLDVTNNTALTQLYCYDNQLTSLDITNNTALSDFICDNNQLTNLDISKNTALTRLSCGNNQLTSLDVTKNTILEELRCAGNQLTSLDVSNTNLEKGREGNEHSLWCYMTTLNILYLKKGWNIEGINKNRSDDYICINTEIEYVD